MSYIFDSTFLDDGDGRHFRGLRIIHRLKGIIHGTEPMEEIEVSEYMVPM